MKVLGTMAKSDKVLIYGDKHNSQIINTMVVTVWGQECPMSTVMSQYWDQTIVYNLQFCKNRKVLCLGFWKLI